MIRFLTLALVAMLSAGPAFAQRIPVQSGEHATFSRLVFAAADDLGWTVARAPDRTVAITFDLDDLLLDLGRIFDLIPRDRIRSAAAEPGRLTLTLGCDCGVSVFRVATGHVVVDIGDEGATSETVSLPRPRTVLPVVLPPSGSLARNFVLPTSNRQDGPRAGPAITPRAVPDTRQVAIHSMRLPPLLLSQATDVEIEGSGCEIERTAKRVLTRDPVEVLEEMPGRIAALLDAELGLVDREAAKLAEAYAALGWGAEAVHVLRLTEDPSADLTVIAKILDDDPVDGISLPVSCGPATAILALLSGEEPQSWDAIDRPGLRSFLDGLPLARRLDIDDRLSLTLEMAGRSDLMTGLGRNAAEASVASTPAEAGTDIAAARAVVAQVSRALESGTALPEEALLNAVALRQSLPDSAERRTLDTFLPKAFVAAGYLSDAVSFAKEYGGSADDLLAFGLERLEPGPAIELAARLRESIDPDGAAARAAALLLEGYGLEGAARPFQPATADPRDPVELIDQSEDPSPEALWLARDLATIAGEETDGDPRADLARLIVERNAPGDDLSEGDLARANRDVEASRVLASTVRDLLARADGP